MAARKPSRRRSTACAGTAALPSRSCNGCWRALPPIRDPWPRVSIWHGTADKTVAPSNADAIAGQWRGVHGLDDAPTHQTTAGPHAKRVWHDETGTAVLEINTIAGMGHGTPLDGELGAAGPYMLDVGISSTREIARFWGLATAARPSAGKKPNVEPRGVPRGAAPPTDVPRETVSTGPKKIIEDALRAAGLMR